MGHLLQPILSCMGIAVLLLMAYKSNRVCLVCLCLATAFMQYRMLGHMTVHMQATQ